MSAKREIQLLLLWIILKFADHVFANMADPDSAFAASSNHVAIMAINLVTSVVMIYLFASPRHLKIGSYVALQLTLFSYCLLTAFWSEMLAVSAGQSIYALTGLILAYSISNCSTDQGLQTSFIRFLRLWAKILLLDYFLRVIKTGSLSVPLDEKSLIAAVVFYGFVIVNRQDWLSRSCFLLIFLGNSFSAVFSASLFWLGSSKALRGWISKLLMLSVLLAFGFVGFALLQAGLITVYGKTIEFMQTGSGRFAVWQSLVDEIITSNGVNLIFGNGYMSERAFLSRLELSWGIDAHNNLLQIIYGTGLLGVLLVFSLWLWPLLNDRFRKIISSVPFLKSWTMSSNAAFIIFGLTSSHYYSRPSLSAVFMTSFVILVTSKNFQKDGRIVAK